MIEYYPVVFHTIDPRASAELHAHETAERFEKLNGVKPKVITRADFDFQINPYWYVMWLWDVVPDDVEYVFHIDSKVLPIRKLPELPELKFAAVMDRHDKVNLAQPTLLKQTGKVFQMRVFVAHRDTQPVFEELKTLAELPAYNMQNGRASTLGESGRAHFDIMNAKIQASFPVHELTRDWNFNITYEKQYYFERPYMINFNSNEFGTWAYFMYVKHLVERIEALGGSLDGPPVDGRIKPVGGASTR